jgi:hypothetical protein
MAHVASWIEYAYEGFPIGRPPYFVRWILRLRLKKMLDAGMPRGVRIPGVKSGTTGIDDMETADAANRLLAALDRLGSSESAKYDNPAFGHMSQEERIKLNLRHAELHLGHRKQYQSRRERTVVGSWHGSRRGLQPWLDISHQSTLSR